MQSVNDACDNIVDACDEIVDLVNSEGVWTVYGWGKRGFINDVGLLGNNIKEPGDNKFLSQYISLIFYIFTHRRKIISTFLQFMGGLLTTPNLTFPHYKYVIAIHPNLGISL